MTNKIIIVISIFLPILIVSQDTMNSFVQKVKFPKGINRCATMEMDSMRRANDSSLPSLEEYEIWLQGKIEEYKNNKTLKGTVLTIPVVVHVIHDGESIGINENISDAQVMSQIDVLNQDFRRMIGTNGYNTNPVGADTEIEFCLAQFDTAGNAFNGIDRVNLSQPSWDATTISSILKPSTYWDPTKYFNIWTVDFGSSGVLGLGQFPDNSGLTGLSTANGSASTDGAVIGYSYFGSIDIAPSGTYTSPYLYGRNTTHVVGHSLGLLHTWGNGGCSVDDNCADTPNTDAGHFGCTPSSGCSTPDMIENYMEFTDDICMNIFTQDQKTRMRTVLSVSPRRMELLNSMVCGIANGLDVGVSEILEPVDTICGNEFYPVVKLFNFGSDTLFSTEIVYEIDDNIIGSTPWNGLLAPDEADTVELPMVSGSFGPHSLKVYSYNVNSIIDIDPTNNATVADFTLEECKGGVISNNVFTPNNDGVNDGFVIDIPQLMANNNSVIIYNRWGDVIREFVNYNNNDVIWNGKDKNGNLVSNGTYFYLIEIPSINYSNSGWVQLIK